ncbi:hypothetical protein ERJ77_23410, partial [Vibrio anguillarum]|nr:hypothetical protein [Vibrio anguillarum]
KAIKSSIKEKKVTNNPALIKEVRTIDLNIKQAQSEPVFEPKIKITSQDVDPYGDALIKVNSLMNRPTAISFFDSIGTPYPIIKTSPEENASFDIETVNKNILIVKAKEEFVSITGFVFLEGVQQPIPFELHSNPKNESDVKRNIILPSISPLSTEEMQSM